MRIRSSVLIAAALGCSTAAAGFADSWQELSGPVKTGLSIEAGVQAGYNLDHNAFGVVNYIRKIGFWSELFNSEAGMLQEEADPDEDTPKVAISIKNFKLALTTFSNKQINNLGADLDDGYEGTHRGLYQGGAGDSFEASLTFKGFWLNLVSSIDGYSSWGDKSNVPTFFRSGFDYTGARPLFNGGTGSMTNTGLFKYTGKTTSLLSTASLFVPDSTQWEVKASSFAKDATYYTYDAQGAEGNKVLTDSAFTVNPYDKPGLTKGILRAGYRNKIVAVDFGVGTRKGGVSLFSKASDVNADNAFNGQVNAYVAPFSDLAFRFSALGGANYSDAEGGTPVGFGGMAAASIELSDTLYLVPVAGASLLNSISGNAYVNTWMATGGLKFLWGGAASAGKNAFSGKDTFRGASLVASVDDKNLVNVQAALFDPAGRTSLVRNLGVQAFAEMKNLAGLATVDGGKRLWGVGSRVNYLMAGGKLNPYAYGHCKFDDAAKDRLQIIARAGFQFSGIKHFVLDAYYLTGQLSGRTENNLGNIVLDLRFEY